MDACAFEFDLPGNLIALDPVKPRDHSKLLVVNSKQSFVDDYFYHLKQYLRPDDLLIFNNTKVIPAALKAIRKKRQETGKNVEINLNLHKQVQSCKWRAFVKPARRVLKGDSLYFIKQNDQQIPVFSKLKAQIINKTQNGEIEIEFNLSEQDFLKEISTIGQMPLPPYILKQRAFNSSDQLDYQTIFARYDGSVAAPTAGLHFTQKVFEDLKHLNVQFGFITLHVGAGTFLPVKTENIEDHVMHSEWRKIDQKTAEQINRAKQNRNRIICVGTTALRCLESSIHNSGKLVAHSGKTDIFIKPGFEFKIADGLITNFHLPKSTLLMLVSAFSGSETIKKAYAHAIANQYRFYSYGDACLLWKTDLK